MPETNIYLPEGESFVYKLENEKNEADFVGYNIARGQSNKKIGELTRKQDPGAAGTFNFVVLNGDGSSLVNYDDSSLSLTFPFDSRKKEFRLRLRDLEREGGISNDDAIFEVKEVQRPAVEEIPEMNENASVELSCNQNGLEGEVYYTLDGERLNEASLVLTKEHHKKPLKCHVEFTSSEDDQIRPAEYNSLASEPFELSVAFVPAQPEIVIQSEYCQDKTQPLVLLCNDTLPETNPEVTSYQWRKDGVTMGNERTYTVSDPSELAEVSITCSLINAKGPSIESAAFTSSDVCASSIATAGIFIISAVAGVVAILAVVGLVVCNRRRAANSKEQESMKLDGNPAAYEYSAGAPTAPHRGPPASSGSDTSLVDHSDNRYAPGQYVDYDPKQQTNNNSSGQYHSLDAAKMGKPKSKNPIGHKDRVDYVEFGSSTVSKR